MTPRAANSLSAADVFAALKDLNGAANVKASFERLGKLLAVSDFSGTVSVQLVDEDRGEQKTSQFVITVANGKAKTSSERPDKPDIEFITTTATWQEVAAGKLTPQEAFFNGRMRLRGKAELARELLKRPAKAAGSHNQGKGEK
jgi:putative sterol carrier protein